MTIAQDLTREEAINDCLRAASQAVGNGEAHEQAIAIVAAIKALKTEELMKAPGQNDYVKAVQDKARSDWDRTSNHGVGQVETPLGLLSLVCWRRPWKCRNGTRSMWAGEYSLKGEPVTLTDLKRMNLAARPTTRNRQSKSKGH